MSALVDADRVGPVVDELGYDAEAGGGLGAGADYDAEAGGEGVFAAGVADHRAGRMAGAEGLAQCNHAV